MFFVFYRYFFDSWTCWRTCWESCSHLNHWTHVLPRSACKSAYYAFNAVAIAGFAFLLVLFLLNAYYNMAFDWVAYFPLISWTFCLSVGTVEWTLVTRWLIWFQSWPFRVWQILSWNVLSTLIPFIRVWKSSAGKCLTADEWCVHAYLVSSPLARVFVCLCTFVPDCDLECMCLGLTTAIGTDLQHFSEMQSLFS